MNEKLITFIEDSFLSPLLKDEMVTDVSYNGVSVFYMHNKFGRKRADLKANSNEVLDFIRQIANFSEKQFSFSTPILDISVGKYRINAVHPSIVRVKNDKVCSFAMRIGSEETRIKEDSTFMNKKCSEYLLDALKQGKSIVIAGPTGSGKTELQKYLLTKLRPNSRVIIIDNIQELENIRVNEDLDITSWQISQTNPNASIQELIRNALRSNPDWLVIAESRGKEMNDALNSVMTGHPIITTLHAKSLEAIPKRIARMILSADTTQKHEDILEDVNEHLKVYVFLNRRFKSNGEVVRFIESIGEIDDDGKMKIIYRKGKDEEDWFDLHCSFNLIFCYMLFNNGWYYLFNNSFSVVYFILFFDFKKETKKSLFLNRTCAYVLSLY